jgi:hypothetical protein
MGSRGGTNAVWSSELEMGCLTKRWRGTLWPKLMMLVLVGGDA